MNSSNNNDCLISNFADNLVPEEASILSSESVKNSDLETPRELGGGGGLCLSISDR